MDINHIEDRLKKFSADREWGELHNPKNLVMALSGEVGELNEIFQWLTQEQSKNLSSSVKEHASDEIADIAIYLINLCLKLDINLEDAILKKMSKNELKYPSDKFKGSTLPYEEKITNQ